VEGLGYGLLGLWDCRDPEIAEQKKSRKFQKNYISIY
jgi:hypothetical protein